MRGANPTGADSFMCRSHLPGRQRRMARSVDPPRNTNTPPISMSENLGNLVTKRVRFCVARMPADHLGQCGRVYSAGSWHRPSLGGLLPGHRRLTEPPQLRAHRSGPRRLEGSTEEPEEGVGVDRRRARSEEAHEFAKCARPHGRRLGDAYVRSAEHHPRPVPETSMATSPTTSSRGSIGTLEKFAHEQAERRVWLPCPSTSGVVAPGAPRTEHNMTARASRVRVLLRGPTSGWRTVYPDQGSPLAGRMICISVIGFTCECYRRSGAYASYVANVFDTDPFPEDWSTCPRLAPGRRRVRSRTGRLRAAAADADSVLTSSLRAR